eukprot:8917104-Lingulodinium_polyedra.AAC.1
MPCCSRAEQLQTSAKIWPQRASHNMPGEGLPQAMSQHWQQKKMQCCCWLLGAVCWVLGDWCWVLGAGGNGWLLL